MTAEEEAEWQAARQAQRVAATVFGDERQKLGQCERAALWSELVVSCG